jgi:uncharacterized membrane protein YhiD involved in acid resistance
MLVPAYQATWLGIPPDSSLSTNPSRMAQGIMTGIGFLGAGVIFQQGFFTVRGLTTAASVWLTAALGILFGIGFFYAAVIGTLAALGVLVALRWLEWQLPRQLFARLSLRFAKDKVMGEEDLRHLQLPRRQPPLQHTNSSMRLSRAGGAPCFIEFSDAIRKALNPEFSECLLQGKELGRGLINA